MAKPNAAPRRANSPSGWTRTLRRARLLLPATLILTACGCGTMPTAAPLRPNPAATVLPQPVQRVDPSLLAECPPLPAAANGQWATLMRNHQQVTTLYHECAARQADLARAVRLREQQEAARLAPPTH